MDTITKGSFLQSAFIKSLPDPRSRSLKRRSKRKRKRFSGACILCLALLTRTASAGRDDISTSYVTELASSDVTDITNANTLSSITPNATQIYTSSNTISFSGSLLGSSSSESTASPSSSTVITWPIVNPTTSNPNWTFPEAFDTILSTNFTTLSCPSFFNLFLASPEFQECHPFSLLLSTSTAFFQDEKDATVLTWVLDQICTNTPNDCQATMDGLARRIQDSTVCGTDLKAGNTLAIAALEGFQNYQMMQQVACLQNSATGNYCFAEAANATSPDALYWYFLAGGTSLPSGTQADCGSCTQSILSIYSQNSHNDTLLISQTYGLAQTVADKDCGPTYANISAERTSSASVRAACDTWIALLGFISSITFYWHLFL